MPPGLDDLLGLRPPRHPFGASLACHVSSDWLMLERRAVRSVLDFARTERRAMRHYRRTVISAESLFATALGADPSISVGVAPRVIRFRQGASNPDVLGEADVPELLESGLFLARKFDEESDPGALDALDRARREAASPRGLRRGAMIHRLSRRAGLSRRRLESRAAPAEASNPHRFAEMPITNRTAPGLVVGARVVPSAACTLSG